MKFPISREARDRYQFDPTLFSPDSSENPVSFHAARLFTQKINEKRDLIRFPEQAVNPSEVNALTLIDEILRYVVQLYCEQKRPKLLADALAMLTERFGETAIDQILIKFVDAYPPLQVYRGSQDAAAYLAESVGGIPRRQTILEDLAMLWLTNNNPAVAPFVELFDDAPLAQSTAYRAVLASLKEFSAQQPTYGPDNQDLIDLLRSPALASPHSLSGQLAYILEKWGYLLGNLLYRLLRGLDLIREEEKARMLASSHSQGQGHGPGRAVAPTYQGQEIEAERFSPDRDWMPRCVVIAKNVYVWMDQLSKKHGRMINRLDQIPETEIDTLSRWGYTGLWLIGLWERSGASQRIKQLCGNPDAVASAYSLYDYQIAADLGGEDAYRVLRDRAAARGVRLASDMVPNHMGIDSRWLIEHPDWFVSQPYSPFPSYTFNGPDLSHDSRVGIFLEDHYYSRSDAAVVFKRVDRWTGTEQFVYHGNDGTCMPWNDTAQLNYLNAEVREAVIRTIIEVAKRFPIIRFDAAMTLAKKHYQRLWFPEPGTGGAIPSRAERGLTKEQFDAAMPEEFWREVVDRVAQEAPDTLLLAEAFWLMEGYFVRTLGMHRVYNSAFMNMLKMEDNAGYRRTIKNTLEFNPEILKRYVNFMNNPDEATAVAQFGNGDKYFGVCTMLVTLPGLPMFGHGQIEGFTEKYGMEFRRAYFDETPDPHLIHRHEHEIFPLVRKRYLFAEVANFCLFDFYNADGTVYEDVFAYSNRSGGERGLVLCHNKYATAKGWIRTSAAAARESGPGGARSLVQQNLGSALALSSDRESFCIFRDHATGLEYLRSSAELHEKGLYVELGAYDHHVFLDFREVRDNREGHYAQLMAYLEGRAVPSIEQTMRIVYLQPIRKAFEDLVLPDRLREWTAGGKHALKSEQWNEIEQKATRLFRAAKDWTGATCDETALARDLRKRLESLRSQPLTVEANPGDSPRTWAIVFIWSFVSALGKVQGEAGAANRSRSWIDEWMLGPIIADTMRALDPEETATRKPVELVKLLTTHGEWYRSDSEKSAAFTLLEKLLRDEDVRHFLDVNRHEGVLWFNKEAFETLVGWLEFVAVIPPAATPSPQILAIIEQLRRAGTASEYRIEKLLEAAKTPIETVGPDLK